MPQVLGHAPAAAVATAGLEAAAAKSGAATIAKSDPAAATSPGDVL